MTFFKVNFLKLRFLRVIKVKGLLAFNFFGFQILANSFSIYHIFYTNVVFALITVKNDIPTIRN